MKKENDEDGQGGGRRRRSGGGLEVGTGVMRRMLEGQTH